jgi:hypothetical protein
VLHHDTVRAIADKLLFEPHDIWAVFALGLEIDFTCDLIFVSLVYLTKGDDFHGVQFVS